MVHTAPLRSSPLLDLPLELITATLCFLDATALLECSLVNRTLHALIADTPDLQYTLALYADGMSDNAEYKLPVRERLALLRSRRWGWRSLDFVRKESVRLDGECAAYELVGSVFAKAGRYNTNDPNVRGPSLSLRWLPDASHSVHTLERADVGVHARDFAIDPSQDLLALVELPNQSPPTVHIHLRAISTNAPHPGARVTTLVHTTGTPVDSAVVQIAGDAIAFFWSAYDSPGLAIWKWTTGEPLVTSIGRVRLADGEGWDFDFLTPRAFILTNLGTAGDAGALGLYNMEDYVHFPPNARPAQCVARLHLPELTPGTRMANISVHSGPTLGRESDTDAFSYTPGTQIHVISIDYFRHQEGIHRRFSLYVRNRTLTSFIYASPITHGDKGGEPVDIPWTIWGPTHTRFMPQYAPFGWLRYAHGSRVCLPPMVIQDGPAPAMVLRILDFGVRPALWAQRDQHSLKSVLSPEEYGQSGYHPNTTVTTLFTTGCEDAERVFFTEPICSSLPCVIIERQEQEWRYTAFMMDDQRLVGMKTNPFTLGDMKDLDVYVL